MHYVASGTCMGRFLIMKVVDRFDATPLYEQLAAILREMITSGELGPRDPLPSEPYLMGEQGLSRTTVRRALNILRDEGLIQTFAGRGTFVADEV
jgi:GntR family transcriptional regulator